MTKLTKLGLTAVVLAVTAAGCRDQGTDGAATAPAVAPAAALRASAQGTPQTVCPVMGGKINKELYVDVEGKRIYVCCGGCIDPIKKDGAKFVKKLEDQGITLAQAPTDSTGHTDHTGHTH